MKTGDTTDAAGARGYRRARCTGCGLPVESCICHEYVGRLPTSLRITVIVAADEATRPSNTTRLLRLWLDGVEVRVRGQRGVALDTGGLTEPGTFVLFPGPQALPLGVGGAHATSDAPVRHLIVPDGTWRQARRIVQQVLLPLGLSCVALPEGLPSLYALRRRPAGNLCTLEATAAALALLSEPSSGEELLGRFTRWMVVAKAHHGGQDKKPASQAPPGHPMTEVLSSMRGLQA